MNSNTDLSPQPQPASPLEGSNTSQSSSIFSNLFQGRLNRRDYLFGHVLVAIGILCVTPLMPMIAVFFGAEMTLLIIVIAASIISITYSLSFTTRRLHDLNKRGFLTLIYLPAYVIFLINIWPFLTGGNPDYVIFSTPPISYFSSLYNIVITIFIIYLLFWPGSKIENIYGKPSTHWTWKEILGFAAPPPETSTTSTSIVISKTPKSTNIISKIIFGIILFFISIVVLVFLAGFIRGFFQI